MDFFFNLFIFAFYLILGVLFIIRFLRNKIKACSNKNNSVTPKKYLDPSKSTAFYLIRNRYFPTELEYKEFFINDHMEEAFNIFLKLSPSMISALSKADKRIITLKNLIDNPLITEDHLKNEIEDIDKILNAFIQASHQMIEKLEEVISQPHINSIPSKLSPEAVEAYMGAVNVLVELTDNHSIINHETHYKFAKKFPNLVEPFMLIAGKITYLFFINLITYSNKIDENLFLYN